MQAHTRIGFGMAPTEHLAVYMAGCDCYFQFERAVRKFPRHPVKNDVLNGREISKKGSLKR